MTDARRPVHEVSPPPTEIPNRRRRLVECKEPNRRLCSAIIFFPNRNRLAPHLPRKALLMLQATEAFSSVLTALRRGNKRWCSPADLADQLGWDIEKTTDVLALMDLSGLILVRDPDERHGPVVAARSSVGAQSLPPRRSSPRYLETAMGSK